MRILVVDDDPLIRKSVRLTCEGEGHEVDELGLGDEVVPHLAVHPADLILLDLMLPDRNGFDVCRAVRAKGYSIPIIILSAKNEEIDVVLGLEIGADDYIQKPFRPRELLARIRASARKGQHVGPDGHAPAEHLVFRGITVFTDERRVERDGSNVPLTHTEFDLLSYLAQNAGRAVSRDQLLRAVWGYEQKIETRVIDVHVRNLRRKIEVDASNPRYILSVPGVGYRFAAVRP